MGVIDEKLLAELNAKDDLAQRPGDTLDVKASMGMVVITFLGTQTAYFLDKHVVGIAHNLQAASVGFLVLATIVTVAELWPRDYLLIEPESNAIDRIAQLREYYAPYDDVELNVLDALVKDEIGWALARINKNKGTNNRKSALLNWTFYLTAGAMVLNAVTLILVWLIHPF
jgi:hypothetical protein